MPFPQFDRTKLNVKPLSARENKVVIENDHIPISQEPKNKSKEFIDTVAQTVDKIKYAHSINAPVMLTMGAHTIKNGMAPTLIKLMEDGWLTHLATNGAGIIHDWEFAFGAIAAKFCSEQGAIACPAHGVSGREHSHPRVADALAEAQAT